MFNNTEMLSKNSIILSLFSTMKILNSKRKSSFGNNIPLAKDCIIFAAKINVLLFESFNITKKNK